MRFINAVSRDAFRGAVMGTKEEDRSKVGLKAEDVDLETNFEGSNLGGGGEQIS